MKKFFISFGYIAWRFPFFAFGLCILILFVGCFIFAESMASGDFAAKKIFFSASFVFLSVLLFYKGNVWNDEEKNWKIAFFKGPEYAREQNLRGVLCDSFSRTLMDVVRSKKPEPIIIWREKHQQILVFEREALDLQQQAQTRALEERLHKIRTEIKTLREELILQ